MTELTDAKKKEIVVFALENLKNTYKSTFVLCDEREEKIEEIDSVIESVKHGDY